MWLNQANECLCFPNRGCKMTINIFYQTFLCYSAQSGDNKFTVNQNVMPRPLLSYSDIVMLCWCYNIKKRQLPAWSNCTCWITILQSEVLHQSLESSSQRALCCVWCAFVSNDQANPLNCLSGEHWSWPAFWLAEVHGVSRPCYSSHL